MSQSTNSVNGNVPEQRTYRVEEIAEILNIGRTSAYTLVKEGHFKRRLVFPQRCVRLGRILFPTRPLKKS